MNTYLEELQRSNKSIWNSARSETLNRHIKIAYLVLVFMTDFLMLGAAMRIAYWIRFELKISLASEVVPVIYFYQSLSLVVICGSILMFVLIGLYNLHNLWGGTVEYYKVCSSCTIIFLIIVQATFIFPELTISRGWLFGSLIFSILMVNFSRFALRRCVYFLRKHDYLKISAAVVGSNRESHTVAKELAHPKSGYNILGLINVKPSFDDSNRDNSAMTYIGSLNDLESIVGQNSIRELIVPSSSLPREELIDLYERVHRIPNLELKLSTGLFELLTTGVRVQAAGGVPLIELRKLRLDPTEILIKSTFEWMLTLLGMVILLPFMLLIAIAIKLDSPGPVIHRRRVMGVGGKDFSAFKFRTMYMESDKILQEYPELDEELRVKEKLENDPRVTRLGHWLRRFSLDEFPQLFNVLLGQMSLVGPRMISPEEVKRYGRNRFNLFAVKPGITGLWQVSGRSDISYEERIRLDMYYIRNYSIWLDLHILFMTTSAVLSGRGAY